MNFIGREKELDLLSELGKASLLESKMTVVIGRRRIGKTRLILQSIKNDSKFLYFFVAKKSEQLLCAEFVEQIISVLNIPVFGTIQNFNQLFSFLMETAKTIPITLIIEEFQEFNSINPSVYSDMQRVWDLNCRSSKLNLILCGSVYSIMKNIFENSKEPLFGRANERIYVKPFNINMQRQIMLKYNPHFTPKDLLAMYVFTGGVAKYVELLVDKKALSYEKMINEIFRENSFFIDEGKNMLIEEFGKEYTTYFSILSLLSSSKTSRSEIESVLQKDIGGYLDRLENEYNIIKKVKPVFAKPGGRVVKYNIEDNFLNFWFRFIYKYRSAVEIENFSFIKEVVSRDFETFSGKLLEKYFQEKYALSGNYSLIGNYWDRGNLNEIDLIAINTLKRKAVIADIKLNPEKLSIPRIQKNAQNILPKLKNYSISYRQHSLLDIIEDLVD